MAKVVEQFMSWFVKKESVADAEGGDKSNASIEEEMPMMMDGDIEQTETETETEPADANDGKPAEKTEAKKKGFSLKSITGLFVKGAQEEGVKSASEQASDSENKDADDGEEKPEKDAEAEGGEGDEDGNDAKAEDKKNSKIMSFSDLKRSLSQIHYDYGKIVSEGDEKRDFDSIFKISNIASKTNDIAKIMFFLEQNASLNAEALSIALDAYLKAEKMNRGKLFGDAINKDKALDTYEDFIVDRLETENINLTNEINGAHLIIAEKKKLIENNEKRKVDNELYLKKWLADKSALETKMAAACKVLGDESKMTVGLVTKESVGRVVKS